jgi:hypothetical protein
MKQPRYWEGVYWIAYNDDPEEKELENIKGCISTGLLADLFGVSALKVAQDILDVRLGIMTGRQSRAMSRTKK